jgi:hypothetical protein
VVPWEDISYVCILVNEFLRTQCWPGSPLECGKGLRTLTLIANSIPMLLDEERNQQSNRQTTRPTPRPCRSSLSEAEQCDMIQLPGIFCQPWYPESSSELHDPFLPPSGPESFDIISGLIGSDIIQCWPNTIRILFGGSPIQIFEKSGFLMGIRIVFANIRTKIETVKLFLSIKPTLIPTINLIRVYFNITATVILTLFQHPPVP